MKNSIVTEEAGRALKQAFQHARDLDVDVNEKLRIYSDAIRKFAPDYAQAVDRLVERLAAAGAGEGAPRPGDLLPPFILPDDSGRLVGLENLLSKGPVVIMFHRGHWCPWCRISAHALAQAQKRHGVEDGRVVAIMPDRKKFATDFKDETGVSFPVLTDLDNGYALSLNLTIWVGPDIERLLREFGRNLPDYQGNDSWMIPIPATFVIGRNGRVRKRFVDPDFRNRMAIDDLFAALRDAAEQPTA